MFDKREGKAMKEVLERRRTTLLTALTGSGLSGLVLNQPAYIYHMTDWLPPSGISIFLVVGPDDIILVSPHLPSSGEPVWSEAILYTSFSLDELVPAGDNAFAVLEQALSQLKLTGREVGGVLSALPGEIALPLSRIIKLSDAKELIQAVTAVKDETAQQAIRSRVRYLDRAFETAQSAIRPGVSEIDVFSAIYTSLMQSLGGPFTLDCTFGSGQHSLEDEPQPTNKRLEPGEVVLIDLFPVLGEYAADYTRNFVVGQPSDAQREQHAILEKALSAAEAMLRPGIKASEIDRRVRFVLEDEGFGPHAYQHHTGHGFGLTIPEPPWLIPADHTPLQEGMVIAVEPGIYHPENGGMRLEGDYIITESGCEPLAGFPARLIPCK